jgi:hypothetical protein
MRSFLQNAQTEHAGGRKLVGQRTPLGGQYVAFQIGKQAGL